MSPVRYEVVEHDAGYAYKVGDVYSETYATREAAHEAAEAAAHRQEREGVDRDIQYEDAEGRWHIEHAGADDHPSAEVTDDADPERRQQQEGDGHDTHVHKVQQGKQDQQG